MILRRQIVQDDWKVKLAVVYVKLSSTFKKEETNLKNLSKNSFSKTEKPFQVFGEKKKSSRKVEVGRRKKNVDEFSSERFPGFRIFDKKIFSGKKLEEMISSRNPSKEGKLERLLFLRKGGFCNEANVEWLLGGPGKANHICLPDADVHLESPGLF